MKDKILIAILAATLTYSVLYKIQIEDSIIEDVKQVNGELFEEASTIEYIDIQQDIDDTYEPIYKDEDQQLLNEVNRIIDEALGIYLILFYFSIFVCLGLLMYFLSKIKTKPLN